MNPIISQMNQAFLLGRVDEALGCARELLHTVDPDDDDDALLLRLMLVKGFQSEAAVRFFELLTEEAIDFTMRWPGGGGLVDVFLESGCHSSELFERLVQAGADPDIPDPHNNTFLHILANKGGSPRNKELDMFSQKILELFPDISPFLTANVYGATPLHLAVLCGRCEMLRILLQKKADSNLCGTACLPGFSHVLDFDQVTPLHLACSLGNESMVRLLLEYGANSAARDKHGRTPCFYAVEPPNKLFCPHYYATIPGGTAVQECKCGILELLGHRNEPDDTGVTPLIHALSIYPHDISGLGVRLLELGADTEQADNQGTTPLMAAAVNQNKQAIKKMLEANTDLNRQNNNGDTALHLLCKMNRNESLACYLIKKGTQFQLVNNEGKSAMELASEYGMNTCVELMLSLL